MPVVRISDKTWNRLKAYAVPLEDTADAAIRRALDAAEMHRESVLGRIADPNRNELRRELLARQDPELSNEMFEYLRLHQELADSLAKMEGGFADMETLRKNLRPARNKTVEIDEAARQVKSRYQQLKHANQEMQDELTEWVALRVELAALREQLRELADEAEERPGGEKDEDPE